MNEENSGDRFYKKTTNLQKYKKTTVILKNDVFPIFSNSFRIKNANAKVQLQTKLRTDTANVFPRHSIRSVYFKLYLKPLMPLLGPFQFLIEWTIDFKGDKYYNMTYA